MTVIPIETAILRQFDWYLLQREKWIANDVAGEDWSEVRAGDSMAEMLGALEAAVTDLARYGDDHGLEKLRDMVAFISFRMRV